MTTEEEVQIIKDAVDTYGFESQRKILQEECAELIVAASHYDRGRPGAYDNFLEELADVDIMISQMIYALQSDTCHRGSESVWQDLVAVLQITAGEAETCMRGCGCLVNINCFNHNILSNWISLIPFSAW